MQERARYLASIAGMKVCGVGIDCDKFTDFFCEDVDGEIYSFRVYSNKELGEGSFIIVNCQ